VYVLILLKIKYKLAYEVQIIFDSIGSFKGYMEKKESIGISAKMAGIRRLAEKNGPVYEGARVYDEIAE
jgi:hypothetical protein